MIASFARIVKKVELIYSNPKSETLTLNPKTLQPKTQILKSNQYYMFPMVNPSFSTFSDLISSNFWPSTFSIPGIIHRKV